MGRPRKDPEAKPAAKKDDSVSKADLAKAKSELRAEFREGFHKIARAVNVDYDSIT